MLRNLIVFLYAGCMPRKQLSFLCCFTLVLTGLVISASGVENPSNPASVRPGMNPELPTIFIAGDSTAAKGTGEHQQGWAVPFADYFDPGKVNRGGSGKLDSFQYRFMLCNG